MYIAPCVHTYVHCIYAAPLFALLAAQKNIFRGRRVLRTPPHFCLSKVSAASVDYFSVMFGFKNDIF